MREKAGSMAAWLLLLFSQLAMASAMGVCQGTAQPCSSAGRLSCPSQIGTQVYILYVCRSRIPGTMAAQGKLGPPLCLDPV